MLFVHVVYVTLPISRYHWPIIGEGRRIRVERRATIGDYDVLLLGLHRDAAAGRSTGTKVRYQVFVCCSYSDCSHHHSFATGVGSSW